jgi:hypothetical protein
LVRFWGRDCQGADITDNFQVERLAAPEGGGDGLIDESGGILDMPDDTAAAVTGANISRT